MGLLRLELTKRSTDHDGRMTEEYTIEADGSENVETIIPAYTNEGKRLPQIGSVNTLRRDAGYEKDTFVDKIRITHDGKDHNTYKATVTYAPPEASSQSDDPNNNGPNYPWNDPTELSQTGDVIMVGSKGTDRAGKPLMYSNGTPVVLDIPVPITNINITRKPLKSRRNSFELSSKFFQKINDNIVTIDGTSYPKHTLLVQAFDVELARFKETNPNTGSVSLTKYYVENIVITYNPMKWYEYVVDEGIANKQTIPTPSGENVVTNVPQLNKVTGIINTEPVRLDGRGNAIFDANDTAVNTDYPEFTPQKVTVSSEFSNDEGAASKCVLLFAPYDEVSFNGLKLDEGL